MLRGTDGVLSEPDMEMSDSLKVTKVKEEKHSDDAQASKTLKRRFYGRPAANAIKLLQACIYKSVITGLFLTSFIAISIAKFMLLMLDSLSIWDLKLNTSINRCN